MKRKVTQEMCSVEKSLWLQSREWIEEAQERKAGKRVKRGSQSSGKEDGGWRRVAIEETET